MTDRFVVIGGDAAGMSAASKAKRDAPEMEVVVLEATDWVSYGACGIPYYVEGVIPHLDDLVVMDPEKIIDERDIDLRRNHEAIAVDPDERTVTIAGPRETYDQSYDMLLLATGGRAAMPPVPGTDLAGVFGVRDLDAGRAIRNYITHEGPPGAIRPETSGSPLQSYVQEVEPTTAAVVGANKIGLELAEAFVHRGLSVHLIMDDERLLPTFGPNAAKVAQQHLESAAVTVHDGVTVNEFEGTDGRVTAIETDSGSIETDITLVDVGVEPVVELATAAGIECGQTGAIATDEYGRTSAEDVFAAGDCAEKNHLLTDETVHWPFALAANRGGRAVGTTVAGTETPLGPIVGTLVMKAFDVELARTGLLPSEARAAGYQPVSRTISTITRAHYYPGWSRMVVHAVADRESGQLLGMTLAGEEGAAHRINAVATALQTDLTVREVSNLDFGYAPPFGPVWDPVLLAAKVLTEAVGKNNN